MKSAKFLIYKFAKVFFIPVKHVSNLTFYRQSQCKNVHHLHGRMPRNSILFPTRQCTGLPCSWNHGAVAVCDTRFHSTWPDLWPPNSPNL